MSQTKIIAKKTLFLPSQEEATSFSVSSQQERLLILAKTAYLQILEGLH
jgi:hypothetical protein